MPKFLYKFPALISSLTLIQACGTTYNLTQVDDINANTSDPGIYYYLPRTQINLEGVLVDNAPIFGKYYRGPEPLPTDTETSSDGVERRIPKYFPYENDDGEGQGTPFKTFEELYSHNLKFCNGALSKEAAQFVELEKSDLQDSSKKAYTVSDFAISTSAEQDTEHLYRLELDAGFLSTVSHTVNVNEKGIFTSSDSTLTDAKSDFAFNMIQSGLNLITGTVPAAAATETDGQCKVFAESIGKFDSYKQGLEVLEEERQLILSAGPQNIEAALVTLLLKEKDAEISKYKEKNKSIKAMFEKTKRAKNYVVTWELDPQTVDLSGEGAANSVETTAYLLKHQNPIVYTLEYQPKEDDKSPKRFTYVPGTAKKLFTRHNVDFNDENLGMVEAIKALDFEISPSRRATHARVTKNAHPDAGFLYRLPVESSFEIKHNTKVISSTDLFVAQYGPILALPKSFSGSSATLHLALNSNTGGFSKATVNTTAIGASSASRYVDAYTSYDNARNLEKEADLTDAKAAAAEVAGEQLRALTSENELLQQEVTNRELRAQLGIDDE